jgi:hypothetical protein
LCPELPRAFVLLPAKSARTKIDKDWEGTYLTEVPENIFSLSPFASQFLEQDPDLVVSGCSGVVTYVYWCTSYATNAGWKLVWGSKRVALAGIRNSIRLPLTIFLMCISRAHGIEANAALQEVLGACAHHWTWSGLPTAAKGVEMHPGFDTPHIGDQKPSR